MVRQSERRLMSHGRYDDLLNRYPHYIRRDYW